MEQKGPQHARHVRGRQAPDADLLHSAALLQAGLPGREV